jgi:hypothetical protein
MKEAVATAMQGATAMGLSWIWGLLEYSRRGGTLPSTWRKTAHKGEHAV